MKRNHLLAAVGLLALAACGSNNDADTAAVDNGTIENIAVDETAAADPSADANMMAPAALPATAQEFADMAAASDTYEIESSKLAETKAQDAKVKEFAAMLVKDHSKSTADLKTAAGAASPAITPAPALNAEQQANLDALKAAGAAGFDQLYLSQQVPAHEKALGMLQAYSAGGDVQPLKEFASKTAPVVQHHLEQARSMQR